MAKAGPAFLIVSLLALASPLLAGLSAAKEAYLQGLAKEKAKEYFEAINYYKASLEEYHAYVYAQRQLGNCYYANGDKDMALKSYDAYLAVMPSDDSVRAFADRLRAELGKGGPSLQLTPSAIEALEPPSARRQSMGLVAEEDPVFQDVFYMAGELGIVFTSSADMQRLAPGSSVSDRYGNVGQLRAGFLSATGFFFEGAYAFGPYREYNNTYADSTGSYTQTWQFSESTFSIEPGFRVPLNRHFGLGLGVALGYSNASLGALDVPGLPVQRYSGSGFSYTPELKFSFYFGKIGLDLDLGYHNSTISPMKDNTGLPLTAQNYSTLKTEAWAMDNSGFEAKIGAVLYFDPPLPDKPQRRRHEH